MGEATPVRRLDVTAAGPADSSANDQSAFRVRFDWGPAGLQNLAPRVDAVVVVDVLSFTTSVDVALGGGAVVFPYRWHDGSEQAFAEENDAVVAGSRWEEGSWSLAPSSLVDIPIGTRLVLPSPNGSALTFGAAEAGASQVVAACIRNAAAVGAAFSDTDLVIGVVAAGERWQGTTGTTRVARTSPGGSWPVPPRRCSRSRPAPVLSRLSWPGDCRRTRRSWRPTSTSRCSITPPPWVGEIVGRTGSHVVTAALSRG